MTYMIVTGCACIAAIIAAPFLSRRLGMIHDDEDYMWGIPC
ncbi:MAG: hypothetical protein QGI24_10055 [Kiritimatiellia bacterium]|jgi:hypothetical protein|nr:hypothetical protein [Kiritimatiellia bacterium]MDP6849118.1 hypothetical protein [Kiritimatiellia bacterium]